MISSMVNDNATFPNYPKGASTLGSLQCTAQQQQCPDHNAIRTTMMTRGAIGVVLQLANKLVLY